MNDDRKKLELLIMEKKSLPECERKRNLEKEIQKLQQKVKNKDNRPEILVRYAGKVVGLLDFDTKENAWLYKSNDGSTLEVGFTYDDARAWASMNSFQLKVIQNA
jgi:hypothetical protein